MKILILVLLFVLSLPLLAQSGWIDANGKPLTDTESMRSDGDFAVQLVLTPDENKFRQTWNSTKNAPILSSTNSVRLGSSLAAMLIFQGCAQDVAGACNVTSEFILESPDGTKTPAGDGPISSAAPLRKDILQLGKASLKIGFGANDPLGNYKVIANVKDKISGRILNLTAGFKVTM